ncbi:tRNA-specific 2-thiouridylase MnmA [Nymphon striatum]|nr:tRNA-specific 2-thiouridylase MnmA [Nymphon striatum]
MCNKEIKFKAFLDFALDLGADYIATGHYARVARDESSDKPKVQMLKGLDNNKDQTYFLYTLQQHQLSKTLFPIGELEKSKVRELAEQADGEEIGKHQGLMYYTLGQRQGLGIGGLKTSSEAPWFVVDKDLKNNYLIAAQGHNHELLQKQQLKASQLHWVNGEAPDNVFSCKAKIRYRQEEQACNVLIDPNDNDKCTVCFNEKQRAMTPGQSIVFYDDNLCLGWWNH